MIAAAEKEGKVVWYTSVDVKVAEGVAKVFRATYPKIAIEVERSGSERVFQRINQEYQSNIKNVDVVNSSDASHFIFWKQQKWLAAHTPPDVKRYRGAVQGSRRLLRDLARDAERHGLQHQPGDCRGGADGLRRSARPEVERQARQIASELQRHEPDRHLRDHQGAGLGVPREARQAGRAAVAVDNRDAQEHRQRRARGDGRRQRIQHVHRDQREEPGEDHLSRRKARPSSIRPPRSSPTRRTRTRRACCRTSSSPRRSSSCSWTRAASARCIRT